MTSRKAQDGMRIAHVMTVARSLPFMRGQSQYAQARGFEVAAFANVVDDLDEQQVADGITVYPVPIQRRISPIRDLATLFPLVRHMRRLQPAIVHAHTPKGGLLGIVAAWLTRVPVRIYHMRGLPMTSKSGIRRLLLKYSEKVSCRLSHRVFCVSHSLRDVAIAERLCPEDKIRVLARGSGQGVDAMHKFNRGTRDTDVRQRARRSWAIPQDALTLGFVGRIVRDKGVEELTTAWTQLRERFPSAHLLVAGSFEPQDPVAPEVKRLLHQDARIHLVGHVKDMVAFYSAVDVLLFPTYREGFPNAPLEAAAMELPVVATLVPGCVDAVEDGVTGTLVPPRDPEALCEAATRYLNDPELRCRHGRSGRERVIRDFRPEVIWEAIYQEYVGLLKKKGMNAPEPTDARSSARSAA